MIEVDRGARGGPVCYAADLVFDGEGVAIAGGAIVVDDEGVVHDVGAAAEVFARSGGARREHLRGLLLPGLVNAHTHLELSHLEGRVQPGLGFFAWVDAMMRARETSSAVDEAAGIERAVANLGAAGVVAIGEVSNGLGAVHAAARAGLSGSVFHELYGYDRARTLSRLEALARERAVGFDWPSRDLTYALAPHTLYTLHPDVLRAIARATRDAGVRTSLHIAEHAAERAFLERGEGPVVAFAARRGASLTGFPVPKTGPIAYADALGLLDPNVVLVHLTTATRAELDSVAAAGAPVVLCPRSNHYIERAMPPVADALAAGIRPALGTDSLASNTSLDVLDEAVALGNTFPDLRAEVLFAMATGWGADALGLDALGRFRRGARPGVLFIEGQPPRDAEPLRYFLNQPISKRRLLRHCARRAS